MSIVYNVRDSDRYVYHYTDAHKALNYILKDRTLLINSFDSTNDPKETKTWELTPFTFKQSQTDWFHYDDCVHRIARKLKASTFLACFCCDDEKLVGDHVKEILNRGLAKPRMWSQYADKHKGFCLVFDKDLLLKKIAKQFPKHVMLSGKVTYKNRSWAPRVGHNEFGVDLDLLLEIGENEYCRHHVQRYAKEIYFEKLLDWRDEREWRVVLLGSSTSQPLLKFEDALAGVVHGVDTSPQHSEQAVALAFEPTIEHAGLKWSNHSPWYDLDNPAWRRR